MFHVSIGEGKVRGGPAGQRPGSRRRICRPRVERLEARCLPGFLAPLAFDDGSDPRSVAVGDFNSDGIPDLAVANFGTPPSFSDSGVSVLLGKGDGTFLP